MNKLIINYFFVFILIIILFNCSTNELLDSNADTSKKIDSSYSFNSFDNSYDLYGARFIIQSTDGSHVYSINNDNKIAFFTRDSLTGMLTNQNNYSNANITSMRYLTLSNDGKFLYAACPPWSIAWFSRNNSTGELNYIDMTSDANMLLEPNSITISPDDKYLYAASGNSGNYNGAVVWYKRDAVTGNLNSQKYYCAPEVSGAKSIAMTQDGNNLYVAATTANAVVWFKRSITTGDLSRDDTIYASEELLSGINYVMISKDQKTLYASADKANSIAWFTIDTIGALTYQNHYVSNYIGGSNFIAESPNEDKIFITSMNYPNITCFNRSINGDISYYARYVEANYIPCSICISPIGLNGYYVYTAAWEYGTGNGKICWFNLK